MGEWETIGHRCGYIRHNGKKSWNAMTPQEREESTFDLHAECCMGVTRRKPHRGAKAVQTAIFQPQAQRVTREMLEGLGFG